MNRGFQTDVETKPKTRDFVAVCASLFLLLLGTYISGTLLVPYTESLGGSGLTVGIIYSCMYAVRLIFGTPIGRLSQRKGSKKILMYSLTLYPLIAVAYWVSWSIPSLLAARLLHGVASAMLLPMAMAYIGEVSPAGQEGRYMAIYNSLLFAASAFGPFVGGLVYDHYGIRAAFIVLFGLAALSFLLMILFAGVRKGKTTARAGTDVQPDDRQAMPLGKLMRNRKLLALGAVNIGMAVLLSLFGASFTQYTLSKSMDMGTIGILIALLNIVIGVSQIPFGRFVDVRSKAPLTVTAGLAAAAFSALIPFATALWMIVVLVLLSGVFISLALSAFSALSTVEGRKAGMSNTMGFLGSANSAGTIIGYLLLGYVTDLLGVNAAFFISAVLFVSGLAAFLLLWSVGSRQETRSRLYTSQN